MSEDRLSQIWSAFAQSTKRYLTDTSIANIPRPDFDDRYRRPGSSYRGVEPRSTTTQAAAGTALSSSLPEGVSNPADAALAALRARFSAFDPGEKKLRNKKEHRRRSAYKDTPAIPEKMYSEKDGGPQSFVEDSLFQDLKTTELLTTRRAPDYLTYAAHQQLLGSTKKKGRGGLFSFFRKTYR